MISGVYLLMNILFKLVLFIFLVMLCAVFIVGIMLGSELADIEFTMPELENPAPKPQLDPNMQRYFDLKNASCNTLSGNFLIVTKDTSLAEMSGMIPLIPEEELAKKYLIDSYTYNQTTRTYMRGDWMKKVIEEEGQPDHTLLWKNGRRYDCIGNNCSMSLMSDNESDDYYNEIFNMKGNCIYFGKTALPESVNISRLLSIENKGLEDWNISRCERFVITANSTYANELLSAGNLSKNQKALLWALANLASPIRECLDESTGIVVFRLVSFNLKDSYVLDFEPDGYFIASQKTELKYFTDNVPESFLGLPEQD